MKDSTTVSQADVATIVEGARDELSTPDIELVYAARRRRSRRRRVGVGLALVASSFGLALLVAGLEDEPQQLATSGLGNNESPVVKTPTARDVAVLEASWYVVQDDGFDLSERPQFDGEVLERVEFASINDHDAIQLSSRCTADARRIEWNDGGFVVVETLEGTAGLGRCREDANEFATRPIEAGSAVAVALIDGDLVLSSDKPLDAWTLKLATIASGLPNDIGRQLLGLPGWQYNDGAGTFDRVGISFASDGSDEGLHFSSDESPSDVFTVGTGCLAASYKIKWSDKGFEVVSPFVSSAPSLGQPCGPRLDGLVTAPLADGQLVEVTTDDDGRVVLSADVPDQESWEIFLTL